MALLVSILMPALGKAREQAKRTVCASNLHQLGVLFITYAGDFDGDLPSFNEDSSGGNLYAVNIDFKGVLGEGYGKDDSGLTLDQRRRLGKSTYDAPHKIFYCPSLRKIPGFGTLHEDFWDYYLKQGFNHVSLGYNTWIPRQNTVVNSEVPPDSFGPGTANVTIHDTKQIQGPKKLSDRVAKTNPIMTDKVATFYLTNPRPENTNIGEDDPAITGLFPHSAHKAREGAPLQLANELFADGHVEPIQGSNCRPRFSNWMATFWR